MRLVPVCDCNPVAHDCVMSKDTSLLRRVRKDSLERAKRWRIEGDDKTAICAEYTAHQCLERLRELRVK